MPFHRRGLLGLTAGAAVLAALPARAAPALPPTVLVRSRGRADYTAALAAVAEYGQAELAALGLPGMTLAFSDDDGFAAVMTLGYADVDARVPVRPDHLFQIGSISKSFAALTLFALADQGKVDLDAPLARYVPGYPLPPEPITVEQVLNHVAGLPDDAPVFPATPDGRLWTGFLPGTHFSYSNTGYNLLGHAIGHITGEPHPAAIRRLVVEPLGLKGVKVVIRNGDRGLYATGYAPFLAESPDFPGVRQGFGPWTQEDIAAGSIAAPPDAMAAYLRFLIALGRGKGAPVLSDAAARRFVTPVTEAAVFGPKARYANGLGVVVVDGTDCLHHTGGMLTFSSSLHVDPAVGVGVFASVNARLGNYRPRLTTAFAVKAMRAARAGRPLPAPPALPLGSPIKRPERFAGAWLCADGSRLEIVVDGAEPALLADGTRGRLREAGETVLSTDHPRYATRGLEFEGLDGRAPRLWWGPKLFGRGAAPVALAPSPALAPFAGKYVSGDPWVGSAEVFVRGDVLAMEGTTLQPAADGTWRSADSDAAAERIRFDRIIDGRAQRMLLSGAELARFEAG